MADNPITIVVRGGPNSGRTVLAKQLEEFLREKGYVDVHLMPQDEVNLYNGSGSLKTVPILITEAS